MFSLNTVYLVIAENTDGFFLTSAMSKTVFHLNENITRLMLAEQLSLNFQIDSNKIRFILLLDNTH